MPEKDLMEVTHRLVQEHGTKWKKLTELLYEDGFKQDDGSALTVDTIRKRYKKWLQQRGEAPKKKSRTPRKAKVQKSAPSGPMPVIGETPNSFYHKPEPSIPVSDLLDLFKSSLERRDAMLADKIKNDAYSHENEDRLSLLEARLEAKILNRLRKDLPELVQERVDQELKAMVTPGGSFERDLNYLISDILDEKGSDELISLLDSLDVKHVRPPGPGRGHKGKSGVSRFSATMDKDVYERMKNLDGTFSSRLTSACLLYLSALEKQRKRES